LCWGIAIDGYEGDVGTAPAVPLPATLPLMLTALGALGVITRRRPGGQA
jgi:hypothetical protein